MYYPKNQITTNLSTNGKEFQIVNNDKFYTGFYFSTSDGRYYTGKTPQDGNNLLLIRGENRDIQLKLTDASSNNLNIIPPET
jgi:hypothetical protein